MTSSPHIVVRLPHAVARGSLSTAQVLTRAVAADVRPSRLNQRLAPWRLCPDERRFATALLRARPNWWLYRTHQRRRAGDFAIVDMSSPLPALRQHWVVDIKMHADLKEGGGGAGIQLTNASEVTEALARRGLIRPDRRPILRVGSRQALLTAWGVRPD